MTLDLGQRTSPLTLGQRCALALLQGRGGWRTARNMRVQERSLDGLRNLGLAVSRRMTDGTTEWTATLPKTEAA